MPRATSTAVHCTYDPATRSGTPGAEARKVKGNIHWLSTAHAGARSRCGSTTVCSSCPSPGRAREVAEVAATTAAKRSARPARSTRTSNSTNPPSATTSTILNPQGQARHRGVRRAGAGRWPSAGGALSSSSATVISSPTRTSRVPAAPVFNRAVTLRDSWGKDAPA